MEEVKLKPDDEPDCFVAGGRIPPELQIPTFWRLFDHVPNDALSTHIVRLVAIQLDKLTDGDKQAIIDIFNRRLDIRPLKRVPDIIISEKVEGLGREVNRKDLEA